MKDIDDKLLQLNEAINRREKLRIHLTQLDKMLVLRGEEKDALSSILAKEEQDVVDIEKDTIYNLFAQILGTREKQLEKERQEYLHALMLYRAIESTHNSLLKEKEIILKSIKGTQNAEADFEKLIKKKEGLLKESDAMPKELVVLNERVANFKSQVEEIDQTIKKGNTAKKKLISILHNLKRINKWGFEGRHLNSSSMMGQTKRIQNHVYSANNALQNYEDHLHDISVHFSINFDRQIKNLEAFLSSFVDNLITDWIVNNKIENSMNFVNGMIDSITKINGSLEYEKSKIQEFLKEDLGIKSQLILDFINKNKS